MNPTKIHTNVYALYSPYLQCYDLPISNGYAPEEYAESFRRLILQQPDQCYSNFFQDKKLCYIGTYNDLTGRLEPFDAPIIVCDLASLFPPGYLEKRQAKTEEYFGGLNNGTGNAAN